MTNGFLNLPWAVWGAIAVAIALVFVFFVPGADKIDTTSGIHFTVLRWFHSLCWLLIALNFFLRATNNETLAGIANLVAAGGGLVYLVFIVNFVQLMSE